MKSKTKLRPGSDSAAKVTYWPPLRVQIPDWPSRKLVSAEKKIPDNCPIRLLAGCAALTIHSVLPVKKGA